MNKEIKDFFIKYGTDSLFRPNHYTYDRSEVAKAARRTISNNLHLMEPYYSDLSESARQAIMTSLVNGGVDIYNESPFWASIIDDLSNFKELCEYGETKLTHIARNSDSIYLSAARLNPKFDWKPLFFQEMKRAERTSYVSRILESIASGVAKQDESTIPLFVRSALFDKATKVSFGYRVRGFLYRHYISAGVLSEKEARKIRSEASEEASNAGLETLIKHRDLYKGRYENLLLKFSDSKHEWVQTTLAKSLPIHLLTSIMGTEYYSAKVIIERRMEEHEDGGPDDE